MKIHKQKTDDDVTPVTMSCIDPENPEESEPDTSRRSDKNDRR